jgi:rare lipoprotein A
MRFNAFLFFLVGICCIQSCATPVRAHRQSDTSKTQKVQYGIASYYADKFVGRQTASGEIFKQNKMTAAHNTLPLGTYVKVTNLRNNKNVVVKINDRLHHRNKRLIDLTKGAAKKLGFIQSGITRVKIQIVDH